MYKLKLKLVSFQNFLPKCFFCYAISLHALPTFALIFLNERKQTTLMEPEEQENEKIKLTPKIDNEKCRVTALSCSNIQNPHLSWRAAFHKLRKVSHAVW
ncbi:hypothetical protein VNO80_31624 [Phaseolus coccineus]|uniref:Uncharacterized protein n=1 Tax=Phaseolus coccineus TaxID=3886 RepID=A0AAN9QDH5_PHACN